MKTQKVVQIAKSHLIFQIILKILVSPVIFFFAAIAVIAFRMFFLADNTNDFDTIISPTLLLTGIVVAYLITCDYLYWKRSGIYINESGDHIVRQAVWSVHEEKLLNMGVSNNQVSRSILQQLLGTATIHVGMMGKDTLHGVVYGDIKKYDDLMRNKGFFSSTIF